MLARSCNLGPKSKSDMVSNEVRNPSSPRPSAASNAEEANRASPTQSPLPHRPRAFVHFTFYFFFLKLCLCEMGLYFLFFNFIFIFGCVGSLLLRAGFLWLRRAGATLRCGAWASHCGGSSCCRAQALGVRASVVVACGLRSCGSRALERRLSGRGTRA